MAIAPSPESAVPPPTIVADMTDYYPMMSRGISNLTNNSGTSRSAFYEQARAAQIAQLRKIQPPLARDDFERERLALETVINLIEEEQHRFQMLVDAGFPIENAPVQGNENRLTTKEIVAALPSTGMAITTIAIVLLFSIVPAVFLLRSAFVADKALPYLAWPVDIAFVLCLFLFLPLSLFPATRPISATGFMVSSYVFGLTTWLAGALISYLHFGLLWTILGFCMFAVGVIPLAIIGSAFHADWMAAGLLLGGIVMTYGGRLVGEWTASRA